MPDELLPLAVVGAHLTGQPLNGQLTERGARFIRAGHTAKEYRLYALENTVPPKPGLRRVTDGTGAAIAIEVWALPAAEWGSFLALVPPPLGLGTLQLDNGEKVKGFICEPWALESARDITSFGGWLAYLEHRRTASAP